MWDPLSVFLGCHHFLVSSWVMGILHIACTITASVLIGIWSSFHDDWTKTCCYGSPPPTAAAKQIGGLCTDRSSLASRGSTGCGSPPAPHTILLVCGILVFLFLPVLTYLTRKRYLYNLYSMLDRELGALRHVVDHPIPPPPHPPKRQLQPPGQPIQRAVAMPPPSPLGGGGSNGRHEHLKAVHAAVDTRFEHTLEKWHRVNILKYAALASFFPLVGIVMGAGERFLPKQGVHKSRTFFLVIFVLTVPALTWLSALNSAWGCYRHFDINDVSGTASVLSEGWCNDRSSPIHRISPGAHAWTCTIVVGVLCGLSGLAWVFLVVVRILGLPYKGAYLIEPYGVAFLFQIKHYLLYESTLVARAADMSIDQINAAVDPILLRTHLLDDPNAKLLIASAMAASR